MQWCCQKRHLHSADENVNKCSHFPNSMKASCTTNGKISKRWWYHANLSNRNKITLLKSSCSLTFIGAWLIVFENNQMFIWLLKDKERIVYMQEYHMHPLKITKSKQLKQYGWNWRRKDKYKMALFICTAINNWSQRNWE